MRAAGDGAGEGGRERALADLGTRLVGRHVRWYESVASTNDLAVRLTEIPLPEGTVIGAEEQTAGRGRWGRSWASPRGGIWLSVILRPHLPADRIPVLGLAAAVAAAEAIGETTGLPARVKWPNDVLVHGQKVVGILAEATPGAEWVVVGVGINANITQEALPQSPGYPATSLQVLLGHPVDRDNLIRALLRGLDRGYDLLVSVGVRAVLARWRELADTLGRTVRVEMPDALVQGVARDIDETGALEVLGDDGAIRKVIAGDLRIREVGR